MYADQYKDLYFNKTGFNVIIVNDKTKIPARFKTTFSNNFYETSTDMTNNLLLYMKDSDVTFVIEDTEIPAHRAILSKRSEYFQAMFSNDFVEARSDKVVLKETNLNAFKRILAFIYTDSMKHEYKNTIPLDEIFEVFVCARFYMLPLTLADISYRETIDSDIPCLLLNNALNYPIDELIPFSVARIQEKAFDVVKSKAFKNLSLPALEHILKIDLNTNESNVFEALVGWMRQNPDCSSSFPELLKNITLYLLEKHHLDLLFKPTPLVTRECIVNLLSEQQVKARKFKKVENQNVVKDVRVVEGTFDCRSKNMTPSPNGAVIFDLKQNYLLNCLEVSKVIMDGYIYKVAVSMDMRSWKYVVECRDKPEKVDFKESVVRFIRIQAAYKLDVPISANIEAFYIKPFWMTQLSNADTIGAQQLIESMKRLYQDGES